MKTDEPVSIDPRLCNINDCLYRVATGKGRNQVLVYTPVGNGRLDNRYETLGFSRGGDYTCYWKGI